MKKASMYDFLLIEIIISKDLVKLEFKKATKFYEIVTT